MDPAGYGGSSIGMLLIAWIAWKDWLSQIGHARRTLLSIGPAGVAPKDVCAALIGDTRFSPFISAIVRIAASIVREHQRAQRRAESWHARGLSFDGGCGHENYRIGGFQF